MINKTVFPNGVGVISEEISHVRSVTIGVWVRCGSSYENLETNGTAHFIEHMLFKGTEKRSAFDIAWAIDSVGGVMNAFTGKELTSFYIKIPDYQLPLAIDVLSDIFNNSSFDAGEIEKEKSVVYQEISMLEDSPDELIHDFFEDLFWNHHPLGLPILGTRERVGRLNREALSDFFLSRYRGENLIITAAGNLKHARLVDLVNNAFGRLPGQVMETESPAAAFSARTSVMKKNLEQVHLVMGVPAPSATSPKRHACMLMNAVLGGSMSSRLFQEVREKRGLAYDIQSYLVPYRHAGLLGVYAGTDRKKVADVLKLVFEAFCRLGDEPLGETELRAVKEQLKGNFLLGMESTDNRMTRLARNEVCFKRQVPEEEVIAALEAVTSEDIRALAAELFTRQRLSVAAIGKINEQDITRAMQ